MPIGIAVPQSWRAALEAAAERWPGVRVEEKPHGVTVHYRLAPERGNEVWRMVRALVPPDHPWFRLLPAREAVEVSLRSVSKGHAVERLMAHHPFHGRRPIFVGDDITDEAGMSMARRFGGVGLRVSEAFGGDPAQVRAWLMQAAERLDGRIGGIAAERDFSMSSLDLGVVGNCAIASLIDRNGRHVWHGLGRLDGDPVFNALLGGSEPVSGFMEAAVTGAKESHQRYLPNTAILETTIEGTGGTMRIVDFAPRFRRFGRMFRPPMLVRRLEPISGRPRVTIRIRPTFDYGALKPQLTSGSNHARFFGETSVLRLTTDGSVSTILHETEFSLARPITMLIGADESITDGPDTLSRNFLAETESYWQTWVRDLNVPFDWQAAVIRAAITLKLCSYEDTGAVLAALTTSVPEAADTPRTWDYRFSWLRDAFFTVTALNRLSATRTMEGFVRFIVDIVEAGASRGEPDLIAPLLADRARHRHHRAHRRHLAGLSRLRTGAHRQCSGRAAPERHLRLDGDDGGADVLGRTSAAARRHGALSPALSGRERSPARRVKPRCGNLGISRARGSSYLFGRDVLGGASIAWA